MPYQSQGVRNQLMLAQCSKIGDDEVKTKEDKQNRRNKHLKETLTALPSMVVDERFTLRETVNDTHRQISMRT